MHIIPKIYQTKDSNGTFWDNSRQASKLILYNATHSKNPSMERNFIFQLKDVHTHTHTKAHINVCAESEGKRAGCNFLMAVFFISPSTKNLRKIIR